MLALHERPANEILVLLGPSRPEAEEDVDFQSDQVPDEQRVARLQREKHKARG